MATKPFINSSESEASEYSDFEQLSFSSKSPPKQQKQFIMKRKQKCPNCNKSFVHQINYRRHLRSHLEYHPYECDVCLECFSERKFLLAHKKEHSNSQSYSCSDCSKTFSYLSALNRHRLSHLEVAPYPCPICGTTFPTISSRSRHVKNHVVSCVLCKINFQNYLQLLNHIASVHRSNVTEDNKHDKPAYIVPVEPIKGSDVETMDSSSNKSIKKVNELEDNKEEFTCFVCEQCFPSEQSMTSHLKAHRIFMCSHCPQFFAHASILRDHEFGHTGNHPFKCDTCQSIFRSTKRLMFHQKECKISSFTGQNPSEIYIIMDTIDKAVDISSDVRAKVENAIKTVLSADSRELDPSPSLHSITLESLQREMDHKTVVCQSSESSIVSQNLLNESVLSTRDLDECNTPSLDFNNLLHFYWLVRFMKELKSVSYPLKEDMLQKIVHINSVVCLELGNSTGTVRMKDNYLYFMYVQKELSFILAGNFQSLYAQL